MWWKYTKNKKHFHRTYSVQCSCTAYSVQCTGQWVLVKDVIVNLVLDVGMDLVVNMVVVVDGVVDVLCNDGNALKEFFLAMAFAGDIFCVEHCFKPGETNPCQTR
jgi:hypothetical protein